MELGLKGKIAVVTGAGQGMGRGIALCLAGEGADVAILDLAADKASAVVHEVEKAGRRAAAATADVSKPDDVVAAFRRVRETFPRIDILVNCAGIGDGVPFSQSSKADWDRSIGVCLYGTMLCTRQVIEGMIAQKGGRVVSILSDAGRVGEPHLPAYSAAKAGVGAFSKALAKEVGRYGITVNCVSPGATMTDHIKERNEAFIREKGREAFEQRQKKVLKLYPLGRYGEPDEVAAAVVFLASERAGFITGQTLSVNGGYSMVG